MARILTFDFAGGTNGADLTPANSGFSLVIGTPPKFTNANVSVGAFAARVLTTTSANSVLQVSSTELGVRATLGVSYYVRLNTAPSALFYFGSTNLGGAARASIRVNADRTVAVRNGAIAVHTSTLALAVGTDYRVEHLIDSVAQTQRFKIFLLHSTTPVYDSGDVAYTQGTIDTFQTALPVAAAGVDYNLSWVALDGATFPGPAVISANNPPTVSAGVDQVGVEPYSTVTLTGTDSDPDGSIASRAWTQVNGPPVTLVGTGASRTFKVPGAIAAVSRTFRYTVTDNNGVPASDDMVVSALAVNEMALTAAGWVALELQAF